MAKKPTGRGIVKKPTRKSTRREDQKIRQASILTYIKVIPGRGGGKERGCNFDYFDSSREEKPGLEPSGKANRGLKTGAKTGEQQQQLGEGRLPKQAQVEREKEGPVEQTDLRNTQMIID